jgi:hypothetical protein
MDIVERLKEGAELFEPLPGLLMDAAEEIIKLRKALEPFATADFENWMVTADCTVPEEAWQAARDAIGQGADTK